MQGFGDVTTTQAEAITNALGNIESAQGRVNAKIEDGRAVTVRDGTVIAEQFQILKEAINQTFGSLQNAPQQVQQAFATAERQFTSTQGRIQTLTATTLENKQAVAGNTAEWVGWRGEIERLDPALAQTIIRIGGVAGAFAAGWAAGDKLNQLFGTDMSTWKDASDRFWKALGVLVEDYARDLVSLGTLMKDVFTFNFSAVQSDWTDFTSEVKNHWHDLKVELTGTKQEMDAVFLAHNKETQSSKDAQKALEDEQSATADLTAEKKKLVEEINAEKNAETQLAATLEQLKNKRLDEQQAVVQGTSDAGYYKRSLDDATASLDAQKQKVSDLTDQYGASNPMTTQAIEKQKQLELAVADAQKRLESVNQSLEEHEQKLATTTEQITTTTEAEQKQGAAQEGNKETLDEVNTALTNHTAKTKDAAQATIQKAEIDGKAAEQLQKNSDKLDLLDEKTSKHTKSVKDSSKAIKDNADASSDASDHTEKLGNAIGITGAKTGEAAEGTIRFHGQIVTLQSKATDAKKPVEDLGEATKKHGDAATAAATATATLGTAVADAAAKLPALKTAIAGDADSMTVLADESERAAAALQKLIDLVPAAVAAFGTLSTAASQTAGSSSPSGAGGGSNLPPYQTPGGPIPMENLH